MPDHDHNSASIVRAFSELARKVPHAVWQPREDGGEWLYLTLHDDDAVGLALAHAALGRFGAGVTRFVAYPAFGGRALRLSLGFADEASHRAASEGVGEGAPVVGCFNAREIAALAAGCLLRDGRDSEAEREPDSAMRAWVAALRPGVPTALPFRTGRGGELRTWAENAAALARTLGEAGGYTADDALMLAARLRDLGMRVGGSIPDHLRAGGGEATAADPPRPAETGPGVEP